MPTNLALTHFFTRLIFFLVSFAVDIKAIENSHIFKGPYCTDDLLHLPKVWRREPYSLAYTKVAGNLGDIETPSHAFYSGTHLFLPEDREVVVTAFRYGPRIHAQKFAQNESVVAEMTCFLSESDTFDMWVEEGYDLLSNPSVQGKVTSGQSGL